jgi:integrase
VERRKRARSRANGEGGISERKDGRVDVELTVHTPDGARRLRTTKKNKTLARQWIAQMRRDYEEGSLDVDSESITYGEYLDRWIEDVVKGSVARHTYRDYEGKVRLHLKPALGRVKLKALTAAHLQRLYAQKAEQGLSPRTVEYIHTTASKALGKAEEWDLVRKNVARYAKAPRLFRGALPQGASRAHRAPDQGAVRCRTGLRGQGRGPVHTGAHDGPQARGASGPKVV